jgi:hypothetical protein
MRCGIYQSWKLDSEDITDVWNGGKKSYVAVCGILTGWKLRVLEIIYSKEVIIEGF